MNRTRHLVRRAAVLAALVLASLAMLSAQTNRKPYFVGAPPLRCQDVLVAYADSLCITDPDLAIPDSNERLTISVLVPEGFGVAPSTILAPVASDSCAVVRVLGLDPENPPTQDFEVVLRVADKGGNADTLRYQVRVSLPLIFSMPIIVQNTDSLTSASAEQRLVFGIARNATTGGDPAFLGRLDSQYCETELPPTPPADIFDARWTIPTTNGALRNIYPEVPMAGQGNHVWRGSFQPGRGADGRPAYPVIIEWSLTDADKSPRETAFIDPAGARRLIVDLRSPLRFPVERGLGVRVSVRGDTAVLEFDAEFGMNSFAIEYGYIDLGVAEDRRMLRGVECSVGPNPFAGSTRIALDLESGRRLTISIVDLLGLPVRALHEGMTDAGRTTLAWDGRDDRGSALPSGMYLLRIESGAESLTRPLVLTR